MIATGLALAAFGLGCFFTLAICKAAARADREIQEMAERGRVLMPEDL